MRIVTSIIISFISVCLLAQSTPKTVNELLEISGTKVQLNQLDELINNKIEEKKVTFENTGYFEQFKRIMTTGFNSKNAEKYLIEYFELNSNEDSLKKIITTFNTPFIQEFTKLELDANSPSKQNEQITFFQNLKTNPPSQTRVQQLVALNNDIGASEMTVKIIKNMIFAMARGGNLSQPKEKQISEEELTKQLSLAFPENFSNQMANQIVAQFLFTYKDVSDEKLNQYIAIWKTSTTMYYNKEMMNAYDYSFSKMGELTGNAFKELVVTEKKL